MARVHNNPLLKGLSGKLADSVVFKQYSYGTVVSGMPVFPKKRKASELQKLRQGYFAEAVKYARSIARHPDKKIAYQATLPEGKSVYHAALQEYLQKKKDEEPEWIKNLPLGLQIPIADLRAEMEARENEQKSEQK